MLMTPQQRSALSFSVRVALRAGAPAGLGASTASLVSGTDALSDEQTICEVKGSGEFPLLQIVDARLPSMAQEQLWRELRLPEVNTALAADLTEIERKLNSAAGIEGGGVEDVVDQLASVDVRLPPAIQGGPDTVVTLLLQNVGGVTAELKLRYPTESELQIEQWADKGEPTAIELKQHMIVDKGILSVSPKYAVLGPGQTVTVTLTMRHLRADDYALPLLLQLDSGKTMAMNLRGRTLVSGEAYLHLPLREFEMGPTPIGLPEPQRHTLELPNYSDTALEYSLDLTELDALNDANYAFPVLQCEAPAGEIRGWRRARPVPLPPPRSA